MNKEWARWIAASINKHFEDLLISASVLDFKLFFEGNHRATDISQSIIEVRSDGGYWIENTRNHWIGVYEINLLVQFYMDDKDNYRVWDLIGLCNEAMSKPFPIFKFGGSGDESLLGCFNRLRDKQEIITHFFGQIEPSLNLLQATVEAHYSIELES